MQKLAAQRRFNRLHSEKPWHDGSMTNWTEKPTDETPFNYEDGTAIWLSERDLGLGGDFLQQGSVAEQSVGDVGESDQGE